MQATTRNSLAVVAAGMADGISAVSLICMHIVVGVVLITGFMRAVPNPYGIADAAAGRPWYRG